MTKKKQELGVTQQASRPQVNNSLPQSLFANRRRCERQTDEVEKYMMIEEVDVSMSFQMVGRPCIKFPSSIRVSKKIFSHSGNFCS
jgi:hypothetical protein